MGIICGKSTYKFHVGNKFWVWGYSCGFHVLLGIWNTPHTNFGFLLPCPFDHTVAFVLLIN